MYLDSDIAIIGSGIVGSTLATLLDQENFKVTLFDRLPASDRSTSDFDGRAYAFSLASCRLLTRSGLGDVIDRYGQNIMSINISEGYAGGGMQGQTLDFEPHEIGEANFGCMLEDRYLRQEFVKCIESSSGIEHLSPVIVDRLEYCPGYMNIFTSENGKHRTGLAILCDGQSSTLARHLGINYSDRKHAQSAVTCAIAHEKAHQGCAHQFFMPEGPLAILPLTGNRSAIVLTISQSSADTLFKKNDGDFLESIRPMIGSFLGQIELSGKRATWPISASIASKFVDSSLALAGDACRRIHPLAGQGLNLGMRDCAALVEIIVIARRRGEDFSSLNVLERYQRWRRFDSVAYMTATDFLNWIYSNDSRILRALRTIGVTALSRISLARSEILRDAAGLSGKIPKLMLGVSL